MQVEPEMREETAQALLPGLQYLAREARDAGLVVIAGIIGRAANDVVHWIHHNEEDNGENTHERDLASRTGGRKAQG